MPQQHSLRAWVKRRRDKGLEPNADAIWEHIKKTWPQLSETDAEAVFQASEPRK